MEEYPYFLPPNDLVQREHWLWSIKEARRYMEWLLNVINPRTDYLKKYLDVKDDDSIEKTLFMMGEKLVTLLNTAEFSDDKPNIKRFEVKGKELVIEDPGRVLNARGKSIAIDMGLLVAGYLMENHGDKLRWEIQKGGKTEMSYHLPVIKGFKNSWEYYEPAGAGNAYAHSILIGHDKSDCWLVLYKALVNDIP